MCIPHVLRAAIVASPIAFSAFIIAPEASASVVNDQAEANTHISNTVSVEAGAIMTGILGGQIGGAQGFETVRTDSNRWGTQARRYLDTREQLGASAGSSAQRFGVWVNGGYTILDNDESGGEYDGDIATVAGGVDFQVTDQALVGVAVGYEFMEIDTTFNLGTYEGEGVTVAPYLGYKFNDHVGLDVFAGYSWLSYDISRTIGGTVTGETDAERVFAGGNLTGYLRRGIHGVENLRVSPMLGLLWVSEDQDAYVDSTGAAVSSNTSEIGRSRFGGEVGYTIGSVEPYVRALGEWDWKTGDSVDLGNGRFSNVDDFGAELGVGMNMDFGNGLSGTVEGKTSQFRADFESYSVSGEIRYAF